jgi:hypothetical protein
LGGKIKYYNDYDIKGAITTLTITRSTGEKVKVLIDTEDLDRVIKHNWTAGWREGYQKRYYIQYIDYYYDTDGNYKGRTILLHKFIMDVWDKSKVDHINHDSLNNTKNNLRVISNSKNLQNRKGANSNNKTGVRNVNLITRKNGFQEYWVQLCKDYKRYKWVYPIDQFEEACKCAEEQRKLLFGEFAGKG